MSSNAKILMNVSDVASNELKPAATTLFQAFENDPLINWVFNDKALYQQNGEALFQTWIKYCVLYGKAFKTPNFESIALRKCPGDSKSSLWRMFRAGMFKTPSLIGKAGFNRLLQFDALSIAERQKNMGNRLFWYCWLLGTQTQHQNQGFATALINHTFALANDVPCYLEATNEKSLAIQLKNGYKLLSSFTLPDSDIQIYSMLRENPMETLGKTNETS